jgi:DNA-binding response OmpR family regulator
MGEKILFVEDSTDLGDLTKQYLETKGFSVNWFTDPIAALAAFKKESTAFSLCLLDVQMPLKSGFELATDIIKVNSQIPFVFLTARVEKKDKLFGLNIGAADYITKPFDIDELVLRIRNIVKRTGQHKSEEANPNDVFIGDVIYNKELLTITLPDKKTVSLTVRESELLQYFLDNRSRRIKKEELLIALWGENDYFFGRSLDVFISRLRKILSQSKLISINNVYGAGYIFSVRTSEWS